MIVLMLLGVGVVAVALLYVVIHKRPVNHNVGLADPSTWYVQPVQPVQPTEPAPELMMIPPPAPEAHGDHHASL